MDRDVKCKTEEVEGDKVRCEGAPELPPRPPPCSAQSSLPPHRHHHHHHHHQTSTASHRNRVRKYVFLCSVCGGLASLLGALFMAVYLILRTYTTSLDYFETIPTYIPAAMLLVTGLGIMCLARRRNRYAFLIKLCGVCCLLCAAICVLVTVTTTVIHMSRLQSLRECVYTNKTRTCTCYSMLLESNSDRTDEGAHYVFNSTPDCEVIHGALYSCLRAMFGLSVIGILVCIFCCMLVYQLLSHERKKMYWEQLELRCRYLYGQPRGGQQRCSHCPCNTIQYHEPRLWASGRIGNLYSPNPVGDEPHGNSGWAWRLPWSRNDNSHQAHAVVDTREAGGSAERGGDSQYGFSGASSTGVATVSSYGLLEPASWGPPPPYSDPSSPRRPGPSSNYANAPPLARKSQPPLLRAAHPPRSDKRLDPTESEVYFADVSSCCNGSVVYDEGERPVRKQPRFVPQERSLRIQRIAEERCSPEACSDMALDGSEEEDPELVSFSNRQGVNRGGRVVEASPMSVSSPSEGHYQGGSDGGSQDSVWSGYSRNFLAPDAQYETIPDTRDNHQRQQIGKGREWVGGYEEQEPPARFIRNINSGRTEGKKEGRGEEEKAGKIENCYDRCGNVRGRYERSPKHHYEEIRESGEESTKGERRGERSPNMFHQRRSPDCLTLVDESQCCHNDSALCRCYADISVHTEPLKSLDI